ncbi:MAG TPA: extracellular solute-binding protein [Burkholderiales bacterium]|nr:extracellular solute-binding protein [Burkholderiales bacterium]
MSRGLTPFLLAFALVCGGAWAQPVVNLYSSMAEKDLRRLVADFEQRQGVKVNVWRSGKNRVLQRVIAEARAGRNEVDVIHNPSPEMEALHREKLLKAVDSPLHANLIPQAVAPHREWAGPRVYIFVQAYNTRVVPKAELPKTYDDLLQPRWKGRVAIEGKEQEWFFTLVQAMGEAQGLKYFRALSANGLQVRMGNALLTNLVVAGDVPFALTLYSYLPDQAKRAGAPVDWIALTPTIAATDAVGIAAHAPHPKLARELYDFMLGDGQALMAQMGHIVSHRRISPELERFKLTFIDPAAVIQDYDRWTKLFEDTIYNR